jgi:hypothetical protein
VQEAGGGRVFMSLDPVPFDQVDKVYAGADIGIVCYQIADQNEQTGWSSSGKLVYYLRHGMPIVIVTAECPSIIRESNCGKWVTDVAHIGEALEEIAEDFDGYSSRARATYNSLFDFGSAFDRLMLTLKQEAVTAA